MDLALRARLGVLTFKGFHGCGCDLRSQLREGDLDSAGIKRCAMATHREGASRQERRQGPQRRRQSAVCGCGSVGVAHRFALARPSGRVWQLEQRVSAFPPLGDKGRLGKSFQCVSRRPRFRIPYDRRNHRPRSPACGGRKGGSENEAIGRSRGGLSTKINVAVDALGNPLRLILTEGQVHDIRQAEALIEGYDNLRVWCRLRASHLYHNILKYKSFTKYYLSGYRHKYRQNHKKARYPQLDRGVCRNW